MTIAILLFVWVLIILAFNYIDYRITRHGGKPNYLIYFLWRGAAAIVHGAISFMLVEDQHYDYGQLNWWQLILVWAPWLGFQVCSFWIVYEVVRNYWTKQPLLYYDTVEHDSGGVDRFFTWTGHTFHAFAKVLALALAVLCAVLLYVIH